MMHAVTHSNGRTCMKKTCWPMQKLHEMHVHMWHAPPAGNGFLWRRVGRHVFLRRTGGLSELKCTCKHRESPLCNGAGLRRWSPPCPNAAKYAVGKQRVDGQREAKQKQDSDSNVANRKRTDFWSSSPSRSASPPPDITPQADTTVQV